jgi:outer membrane murein-binding lipoprotein Lpp
MGIWLFWIGFTFVVVGLGLSLRAIYIVTTKRGLDAAWFRGLRRTQSAVRQIWSRLARSPEAIDVRPVGIPRGEAFGSFVITGSASGTAGPLTVEARLQALEEGIQQVRDAISAQAHDLSGRVDSLRADSEQWAAAIEERIESAEQEADKIDAVAFNSEMLGVACIALGTLAQAISTLL